MSFKRRGSQADKATGTGPNGRNICKCGCGREVQGRRINWFGDECVRAWSIRNDPQVARHYVGERDKGVCAGCGFDTKILAQRIQQIRTIAYKTKDDQRRVAMLMRFKDSLSPEWQKVVKVESPSSRYAFMSWGHLWEADHIKPVVEGGGQCGLENLRTLCIPCHKKETRALAARRAEARAIA